jgi:aminoglycoside/choline kinase family phosphotransferase
MQYGPRAGKRDLHGGGPVLLETAFPVPQILAEYLKQGFVLLEDAGDADLWSFRDAPWETRRPLYGKVLEAAHRPPRYPRPEEAAGELA